MATRDMNEIITEGTAASGRIAVAEAIRYNQPLIVWRDGQIVEIPPEELKKIQAEEVPK